MVNYARVQHHIDKGLGIAGRKLGPPFSIYRVEPTSSGDFPGGWSNVANEVSVFRRKITEAKIESALQYTGTLWYDIIADMEPYLLGDVMVLSDPPYVPGVSYGVGATSVPGTLEFNGLALAWHSPVNKPVGARVDRRAQIFRPMPVPDVKPDGSQVWRGARDAALPLVLSDGVYSFGQPAAEGSWVPVGVSSTERPSRSDNFPPKTPAMVPTQRYYIYIPPLPGWEPSEGDRVEDEYGVRYVVYNSYRQETGVVGSQLAVERTISQR